MIVLVDGGVECELAKILIDADWSTRLLLQHQYVCK